MLRTILQRMLFRTNYNHRGPMRVFTLAFLCTLVTCAGMPSLKAVCADGSAPITVEDQLQGLITEISRQVIPHNYEDKKHWGQKKEVVRGLYVRRKGLRIQTHRTKKSVNHGTWTRYEIQLLDPDRRLHIRLDNVHQLPNQRLAFDIVCDARLRILGQLAHWQQGVQLLCMSAEATADVRLVIGCDVSAQLDFSEIPPSLVIDPAVRTANLDIKSFRLNQLSRIDEALAHHLSASVRELAEREIARRNEKLLVRVNRQLDKNRDRFRLSLQAALHGKLAPSKQATDDSLVKSGTPGGSASKRSDSGSK